MNKEQAKLSIKNLYTEAVSLNPSAVITLFEFDISDIAFDKGIIGEISNLNESDRIFRFHNNLPDINANIIWQNKSYSPIPLRAEGFELNGRGTLPTPRLSISTIEDGIPILSQLKYQMSRIGDLVGTKVTRIRTLYKYLDAINFEGGENPSQDPNAEFPRDVYYIDRKSFENKTSIEFELSSILDIEGIKLPGRIVIANRCLWQYRGEGCCYEKIKVNSVHGVNARMPSQAPPVATEQGELISNLLPASTALVERGKWQINTSYSIGDYVYIEKNSVKYYFVAKVTSQNISPPDGRYWIADACSKQVENGCKLRWGVNSEGVAAPGVANGNPHNFCLPFGGFPAVNKVQ